MFKDLIVQSILKFCDPLNPILTIIKAQFCKRYKYIILC